METIEKYRKRKRGNFGHFTPESRAKIAKWACEYGYTSAAKRFSKELMRDVNESTVRLIKKQYLRELQNSEDGNCTSLHEASRGRPPSWDNTTLISLTLKKATQRKICC